MKIDIYKSTKSDYKYLSVLENTDVTMLNLPADIDPDLLTLSPLKTSLELDLNKPRAALDQDDVINQITKNGFAVHGAKIELNLFSS